MYYSNNVQVSNSQASTSPLTDSSTILSSVNIYEKFPFLNELKFEKYRQMYYQNVDTTGRLSIQTTYELFSYLNLPSKVLEHTWSLCDVHAAEFLSLPEFLLFIYFLDLYLSSYELPTTLPTNLRQEVQLAEEKLGEVLVGNSPTDDTSKSSLPTTQDTQSRVLGEGEEEKEKLNSVSVVTEPQAKMASWLSPNKEPPDCNPPLSEENLSENRNNLTTERETFSVDSSVNSNSNIEMLTQKINTKQEILERLIVDSMSKQQEWDSIEQLKARIKVIQNEINSVEESQPEIEFDKLVTQMIHFSEQRSQSEMEFEERISELNSLSSKARDLNEKLALARLKLFHTKDSKEFKTSTPEMNELSRAFSTSNPINGMVDEQARLKQKAAEMLAQRMQALTITLSTNDPASIEAQARLDAEKARIEQEKRRSLKEIELVERKVHRMNTRLERGEPSIHTYSKILMGNRSTSESKLEYLDGFIEELKNSKSRPPMSKKSGTKPLSPISSTISISINPISLASPHYCEEKQSRLVEEAQKRLIERERYLNEDFTRLKEEKEDAYNRIRRQEIEWKSIRHQALAQAQTTIANARAEMQAAREETAAKANRNNRARLAEESEVIEMLVLEKIEAADRESHAIERLAKQKIDAACREKEDLEKKFRERMHQVEIAIKKTELEKNEIQNGKQNMCNSHAPPPVPPPPLPISSSPSLVGNQPLWLNHKPPSPTDFPRTSISSIQKIPISSRQRCGNDLQSYPFVSQPPVYHKRHSGRAITSHRGTSQPRDNQQPLDQLQIGDSIQHGYSTLESVTCSDSASTLSFSVKTLYSYTAPGDEYLSFEKSAYIVVDPAFESDDWWFGKLENSQVKGWFPKTYVSIEKIPGQVPFLARVLYDYEGARNDELVVKADSVVDILEKTDVNWWKAQYQGNIGMIPARYVQQLMTPAH